MAILVSCPATGTLAATATPAPTSPPTPRPTAFASPTAWPPATESSSASDNSTGASNSAIIVFLRVCGPQPRQVHREKYSLIGQGTNASDWVLVSFSWIQHLRRLVA